MQEKPTFQLLRVLGSGGMGDVYLARMVTRSADRCVALKRIRPGLLTDERARSQFLREAHIGSVLQHPNIVSLVADGEDEQGPFLAMEFVDGLPASKLIRFESQSPSIAFCIAHDAAEGLVHAHAFADESLRIAGVIHRDISPENILVGRDGVSKVSDFGIAKFRGATGSTDTGSLKGKLSYMAPELFHGGAADIRSDVYAFGATLYWMLCGVAPFHGRTEAETVRAVLFSAPVPPSALVGGIPSDIDAWVMNALEKDRARRPPNLESIARLLQERTAPADRDTVRKAVSEALGVTVPAQTVSSASLSTFRGAEPTRRRWKAAAVSFMVLAASAAGLSFMQLRDPPPAVAVVELAPREPTPVVQFPPRPGMEQSPSVDEPKDEATTASALKSQPRAPPRSQKHDRALKRSAAGLPETQPPSMEGTLLIQVTPWADVFVNGEHKGRTPFAKPLTLPPGKHNILFINNELKRREPFQVDINRGRETELRIDLSKQ